MEIRHPLYFQRGLSTAAPITRGDIRLGGARSVFVRLGDVVRALRALEARGGSARLALFERTWGPYAYAALGLALEWGLAERRGGVYRLSGRGRRLLRELEGCPSRLGQ
jgi:hypothetical protein